MIGYPRDAFRLPECHVLRLSGATIREVSANPLAEVRREGCLVYHKRTALVGRTEGLESQPKSPKPQEAAATRRPMVAPTRRDKRWSIEVMHDKLRDGLTLRTPTVVDQHRG